MQVSEVTAFLERAYDVLNESFLEVLPVSSGEPLTFCRSLAEFDILQIRVYHINSDIFITEITGGI